MAVYAGIDEAGYGPLFGPLVVGRAVFEIDVDESCDGVVRPGPSSVSLPGRGSMWDRLSDVISPTISQRKGRITVNDSKRIHTKASGTKYLELGVLSFADLAAWRPSCVGEWLDGFGETTHRELGRLPWYEPTCDRPWDALPIDWTAGEMAIARSMLKRAAEREGFRVANFGASVVFEDRFNRMVGATHSKASVNFTFVAGHLQAIWNDHGEQHPLVVVDRQSGRTHYLEQLRMTFPDADMKVIEESNAVSAYHLVSGSRSMVVRFEVGADGEHMPVALASMVSKFTRELMMKRFKSWFAERVPDVKPTAGYGTDGKRFWEEIQPRLETLSIDPRSLRRQR